MTTLSINMNEPGDFSGIMPAIQSGTVVPYLGPGVLFDVKHLQSGEAIPADSDSLILAMNGGRPMSPRLMYEFPRAAMDMELKKGRSFVNRFLEQTYADTQWSRAAVHDWLASLKPPYVIDVNRDTQLQDSYADTPHLLVRGIARIGGTDYRFRLHQYDGERYHELADPAEADTSLPILLKPMGSPLPEPTFIASDADYVDYITELMGGFGLPAFIKEYRKKKQYLFLGLPLSRDTERMVMSDIIYAAGVPAGWALIEQPTDKEVRFCAKMRIEIIKASVAEFVQAIADSGSSANAEASLRVAG
jgi:SIR2-like domain